MYFEERKRELIENINIENDRRKEENEKMKENEEMNGEESTVVDVTDESQEQVQSEVQSEVQSTEPVGVSAESSINITQNGNECPNSGPSTEESVTPSKLMEAMINDSNLKPSKSWADSVEE